MSFFTDFAHSIINALATLSTPALAIVLFTVAVRLLISPLTYWQIRGQRRQAALAPQMSALRDKHKNDPMALATATVELQREHGISPFSALLPALAQAPFLWLMYRVSNDGLIAGSLFGHPLTAHAGAAPLVFAALIALSAALAWYSSRRMLRLNPESPRWMTYLPYLAVPFLLIVPLATSLYLVTSSAWSALEQTVLRRPPATPAPAAAIPVATPAAGAISAADSANGRPAGSPERVAARSGEGAKAGGAAQSAKGAAARRPGAGRATGGAATSRAGGRSGRAKKRRSR